MARGDPARPPCRTDRWCSPSPSASGRTSFYPRALLGDLSRVAARTITAWIWATVGERDLSVGVVASIQTHGSLANWRPHLHLLVTDGGFRSETPHRNGKAPFPCPARTSPDGSR